LLVKGLYFIKKTHTGGWCAATKEGWIIRNTVLPISDNPSVLSISNKGERNIIQNSEKS
jgi:hypothetical protein